MDHIAQPADEELGFHPIPEHTKVAVSMLRFAALLSDELDTALQEKAGLGLSEALVVIQIMIAGGRLKMAELADTLVVTRGGVTKIVDRLVEGGYLARVPSEADRRVVYAAVTERAFEMVRDHQPVFDAIAQRRVAALLDASELTTLHQLIDRLSCENPGWEPPVVDLGPAATATS